MLTPLPHPTAPLPGVRRFDFHFGAAQQGREKVATKKKAKEKKVKGKEAAKAAKAASVDKSVDELLAEIEAEAAAKLPQYSDVTCTPPSPRSHCSLSAHPTKNELYMFGGEHNNGRSTKVFSELFVYVDTRCTTCLSAPICFSRLSVCLEIGR